ncbi:hypothetical protein RQP46_003815 [Phenoliferia psychrophenolica]
MEKVQLSLERFLPELRDLERKNIFSKDEISDIVTKRRAHEVAVSKREVKPIDYLRYIEYEGRLEKLRKVRAGRIKVATRKTLSDHSIAAHITHLHRLSTRRFPSSIVLWDAALAHALSQASPLLVSRTLSSAIAMHPTHVKYWLLASRWESEGDRKGMGGGNTEAARRLCMRALRFLKGADGEEEVWAEWVRVEVVYVERIKKRWEMLGIGKKDDAAVVEQEDKMVVEGEESEEVDLSALEQSEGQASAALDQAVKEVETTAVSGQEAIRDGAVVRVVLDSCLTSYSHSMRAYTLLITLLRTISSSLRLPLLAHVYTSLAEHHPSTSPSYPSAVELLATRPMYDIAYDPTVKDGTAPAALEGEALVDAVGAVVDEFWKACKGKKGKGKEREKAPVEVWERFCGWLEEMEDESTDENLTVFLTTNLTTALSLAPPSPTLSLLHLRHLLRNSASPATILACATSLTTLFGGAPSPPTTRVQAWLARLEVSLSPSLALSPSELIALFTAATNSLPYAGSLWSLYATYITSPSSTLSPSEIAAWYETAIATSLLTSALPPPSYLQPSLPREILPASYLAFLLSPSFPSSSNDVGKTLERLLAGAPTLPLAFLRQVLDVPVEILGEERREKIVGRVLRHREAAAEDWARAAKEQLAKGEVAKANEVVARAGRALGGREKEMFERAWEKVCDGQA